MRLSPSALQLLTGLSLDKAIPDHTTIMNFRHLLARNNLARKVVEEVSTWLSEANVLVKEGTLMDATIIEAPSSTQNQTGKRASDVHQTQKGNQSISE